jgi:prolyl-tRNA synthetase
MIDLYSFHKNEQELKAYYQKAKEAYFKVYERLGIKDDTYYVAASGGDFTDDFSHEFQAKCQTGEDIIFYSLEDNIGYNREVAPCLAPEPEVEEKPLDKEEIFGEGIIGVEDLCNFLHISPQKTTKTLIYNSDKGIIIAAVRGDYEVNEEKLRKSAHVKWVKLADEKTIKDLTGAEIGYAGIVNLPSDKEYKLIIDESVRYLKNFETGANKTNYHVSNVNWFRDIDMPEVFYDIKVAKEGDLYPDTGKPYTVFKACEVGNIFPLGTKYSKACNYFFTDEKGEQQLVWMGSYGIGISRTMGVLVEKYHDDKGIIWPQQIAPFKVHLVGLNLEDATTKEKADSFYNKLISQNIEVLYDDRTDISAGEKFADADLIGIPYRIVISKKTGDLFELKKRTEEKPALLSQDEIIETIK